MLDDTIDLEEATKEILSQVCVITYKEKDGVA
jgi:hypothetical protein